MLTALYHTRLGRCILKILTKPVLSKVVGRFLDSPVSHHLIPLFVKKNQLDLEDYLIEDWTSFNNFFVRSLAPHKRPMDPDVSSFIAPCDGLLSVDPIGPDSVFEIKDSCYTIASLLKSKRLADEYAQGQCLIFRLTPSHYHRYCYPDSGWKTRNMRIEGILHTVQPIATQAYPVYKMNSREYTLLKTNHFGNLIFMEVGAMMVGRICNYHEEYCFQRGEEKGRFEFGGSTIVVLVKKGKVQIKEEILTATKNHREYPVKLGQAIGSGN